MKKGIAEELIEILKKDDLRAFKGCMEKTPCGNLRFGRFPILSVMYLLGCKKIIRAYEREFIKLTPAINLGEDLLITSAFRRRAGKCLRYYEDLIVTPHEMLLILEKTGKFKKLCRTASPAQPVKERLERVYFTRYALKLGFDGDELFMARRPLNRYEKKNIMFASAAATILLGAVSAVPFIVNLYRPFIADEAGIYSVHTLSAIDFSSENIYRLKNDLTLPENFYVRSVKCTIIGDGKTITVSGNSTPFGTLLGTVSDVDITTDGSCPVFGKIDTYALIDGVTLNVNCNAQLNADSAFLAEKNYGTVKNLTAEITGKLSFIENASVDSRYYGGLVVLNSYSDTTSLGIKYGEIRACTLNYNLFELSGNPSADAAYGGVSAVNYGILSDCTVTGSILADTVDVGGVCAENRNTLTGNVNLANICVRSESESWLSNAAGLVLTNSGSISNGKNYGEISAENANSSRSVAGGIAATTTGSISACYNCGEVSAQGKNFAYAGGIVAYAEVNYPYVCITEKCVNERQISAKAQKCAFAGGIIGLSYESAITADGSKQYFGAEISSCYDLGGAVAEGGVAGAICGGVGANIYANNEYTLTNDSKRYYFADNGYASGELNGIGMTVAEDSAIGDGGNKGCTAMSAEVIKESEIYLEVTK